MCRTLTRSTLPLSGVDIDAAAGAAMFFGLDADKEVIEKAIDDALFLRAYTELLTARDKPLKAIYEKHHHRGVVHWRIRLGMRTEGDLTACGVPLTRLCVIEKTKKTPISCKRCLCLLARAEQARAERRCES